MSTALLALILGVAFPWPQPAWAADPNETLQEWLAANNPKVISFLRSLTDEMIGSTVRGVTLTDGTHVLEHYKYLGQVRNLQPATHVYLFSSGTHREAYIWVDASGTPLPTPECETDEDDDEPKKVLSGDVYTFADIQPGDGVIIFKCPKDGAWRVWAPNQPLQRPGPPVTAPTRREASGSGPAAEGQGR